MAPLMIVAAACAAAACCVPAACGADHWAFQPLAAAEAPGSPSGWGRSEIDRWIEARLTEAGLPPTPGAARRDLLRRAYFVLVGLPPSPEEVDAFLADGRPEAFVEVVDRLLASRQFGERWGRHWLDLARYADSNGLDENFLFREAWRYRNWVIDAVTADMPFDRFVLEQIAGDLLPYDSIEQRDRQRIAGGFLVIGPKVLLGSEDERQRMEVADEQLDTIGKAALGISFGCARCHDHKFDPVPTRDYYAMAGIFTSTKVMERRFMLNEQRDMERLAGLGANGGELDDAYEAYWREHPELKKSADHAKRALELLKAGDAVELEKFAADQPDALAEPARDAAAPAEERIAAQSERVAELDAVLAHPPPIPPRAMIPSDRETPGDEKIRIAGEPDRHGESVPRGFLQVLQAGEQPALPDDASGRVEFARWLTDMESGAGHLVARVLANRIWHHVMGRGIVRTADNFGATGEPPTHPELLDYLARQLIASGWSVKSLVREVVLSRAFAMSSSHEPSAHAADPDNGLHWRAHRRRMDPEALRDAILAVSGQLDLAPMESTVAYLGDQATAVGKNENRRRTDYLCRSVYLPVIRNDLPEVFEAFDFADPHVTTGARPRTTVPTQSLFLMNDAMVLDAAAATARRILEDASLANDETRIRRMVHLMFCDEATREETEWILTFIKSRMAEAAGNGREGDEARHEAWSAACHAMLVSSRFQFID